jgi:hypothetical protein
MHTFFKEYELNHFKFKYSRRTENRIMSGLSPTQKLHAGVGTDMASLWRESELDGGPDNETQREF